jgi:hypothetical protein
MNLGTASTEYPEVGKLYRVHRWTIVLPPSFIPPGRREIDQEAKDFWVPLPRPNVVPLVRS